MHPIAAAFFRSLNRRRTLMHLRELDDHLLADIGLTPAEARRITGRRVALDLFGSPNR